MDDDGSRDSLYMLTISNDTAFYFFFLILPEQTFIVLELSVQMMLSHIKMTETLKKW